MGFWRVGSVVLAALAEGILVQFLAQNDLKPVLTVDPEILQCSLLALWFVLMWFTFMYTSNNKP